MCTAHPKVFHQPIKVQSFGQWVVIPIFMDLQTSFLADKGVVTCQIQGKMGEDLGKGEGEGEGQSRQMWLDCSPQVGLER